MRKYCNNINVNKCITEHKNEKHETPINCNILLLHALLLAMTVLFLITILISIPNKILENSTFSFK